MIAPPLTQLLQNCLLNVAKTLSAWLKRLHLIKLIKFFQGSEITPDYPKKWRLEIEKKIIQNCWAQQ